MQQVVRRGWLAAGTGAVGPSPRESSLSAHCLLAGAVVPGATESPGQGQVPRGGSAPGGRGQGGHAGSPTECGQGSPSPGRPGPKATPSWALGHLGQWKPQGADGCSPTSVTR